MIVARGCGACKSQRVVCGELRVVSGQGDLGVSLSKSGQSAPRNRAKIASFLHKEALFLRFAGPEGVDTRTVCG